MYLALCHGYVLCWARGSWRVPYVLQSHDVVMVDYRTLDPAAKQVYFAKLRRRNFVAVPIRGKVTLATLGSNVAITGDVFDSVLVEDLFCISCDINVALRDHTAGEGPIEFGLAHGDYSAAEIEECLSVSLLSPDNKIEGERARRLVRRIGYFAGLSTEEVFNNGVPKRVPLRWTQGDGTQMDMWAANRSGAALTTGTILEFQGTMYGRWQR